MEFNSDQLESLLERLRAIFTGAEGDAILTFAGTRVGEKVIELLGEYPPQTNKPLALFYTRERIRGGVPTGETYKSKFKTLRQQRYVMGYLVRNGDVPYLRTGYLGESATTRAEREADSIKIRVGVAAPYAPYVIGDENEQSFFHRGNWPSLAEIFEDNRQLLEQQLESELSVAIEARLEGTV